MCKEKNKAKIFRKFRDAFEKDEILKEAENVLRCKLRELWKLADAMGISHDEVIKVYEGVRNNVKKTLEK